MQEKLRAPEVTYLPALSLLSSSSFWIAWETGDFVNSYALSL